MLVARALFADVTVRRVLWGLLMLGYAWWATGLETFSAGATAAVLGGGIAAVAWGTWHRVARRDDQARPRSRDGRRWSLREPGLLIWSPWLGMLVALQLWMYTHGPREEYPTLSSIINSVLASHGARSLACAAWLAGAAWLARCPGLESSRGRP